MEEINDFHRMLSTVTTKEHGYNLTCSLLKQCANMIMDCKTTENNYYVTANNINLEQKDILWNTYCCKFLGTAIHFYMYRHALEKWKSLDKNIVSSMSELDNYMAKTHPFLPFIDKQLSFRRVEDAFSTMDEDMVKSSLEVHLRILEIKRDYLIKLNNEYDPNNRENYVKEFNIIAFDIDCLIIIFEEASKQFPDLASSDDRFAYIKSIKENLPTQK